MKIFVLGSKGMLGRYVAKYLRNYYELIEINRNTVDAANITEEKLELKLKIWGLAKGDVIINCIGTIKPQVEVQGELNTILINSIFPRILANVASKNGARLIHPTTDCVYSGSKGNYTEQDPFDINDVYGMTKALGEPLNATCIRTSIIGEEVGQSRSLVEWAKANANSEVFGYTNHYWNGITCLQFAKNCHLIILDNMFWTGIRHVYSNFVTKAVLVKMISTVYDLNLTVKNKETDIMCNRTLSSVYNLSNALVMPPLIDQITTMREFSDILYAET